MSKDKITLEITAEELGRELHKRFSASIPNAEMLTEVIMGNLRQTDMGLEQLFRVMQGLQYKTTKLAPGMPVWVKLDIIPTYDLDVDRSRDKGLVQGDWMKAQISRINHFVSHGIEVKYERINKQGKQESRTYEVSESYVERRETIKIAKAPDPDDDLPF